MQAHQSVAKDIHRPRMPEAPNGLSKARGCLWYSLANWKDKMLRFRSRSVADLGDGPGPQTNRVFLNKKDKQQPYISSPQCPLRDTWLANWGAGAWKIWRVNLANRRTVC